MPSVGRLPSWERELYSVEELTENRRLLLRFARSLPPGCERNKRRWVELSLRALLKDPGWVRVNTAKSAEPDGRAYRRQGRQARA